MSTSSLPDPEPTGLRLRADAAENRRRIIEAAQAVFAERGIDAPLDEIARRAGVGQATLYRRFPTRDDLIAAALEEVFIAFSDATREALHATDPWEGFCRFVERICAMQATDRGACDFLTMPYLSARGLEDMRKRNYRDIVELVRRAQASGQLRPDFSPEDLPMLLAANAGILRVMSSAAPEGWQRFVALFLDGCRAEGARPLPAPLSPTQVYRAMRGLVRRESSEQSR